VAKFIRIDGALTVGPPEVSECGFNSVVLKEPLHTTPDPKSSVVDSGMPTVNVNSPSSFVTLPTSQVTQGDTLYVKSQNPVLARVTFYNPIVPSAPTVSVFPLCGRMLMEIPQASYLYLLEVQGVGQIVYLVSGSI
jgi:hypothetical protein